MTTDFTQFKLPQTLLDAVTHLGFEKPTPIQAHAIPLLMEGRDVIGSAQTGTGKTAAFALPILSQIHPNGKLPQALVLVPTRELACQVEESFREFSRMTQIRTTVLYGGVGYGKQLGALKRGTDVIVATPGRLLDHITKRTVNLSGIRFLVLDEADRMLDMGFLPDVRKIVQQLPRERQTALFSATIPPQIESLIHWAMRSPETVEVGARRSPAETVRHVMFQVAETQKTDLLRHLLRTVKYNSAIVFCRTKHGADRVARTLKKDNHRVAVLHSNRTQRERDQALQGFRSGHYNLLVATDIAARGIDVPEVSHVFNYDVPQHPEDYVHRIGRTGRAEASGEAFTLMVAGDIDHVRSIERFIGKKIAIEKAADFNYEYTALFEEQTSRPNQPRLGKVRAVRLSGGYYFGRAKRRR